jgi:ferritin-like metal-binding protein YciE
MAKEPKKLDELFHDTLKDIYFAEKKLLVALPKMAKAAQAVEHYEISRYGTLKTWADELGLEQAVKLLGATLDEEKKTDAALTQIAESVVNQHAE